MGLARRRKQKRYPQEALTHTVNKDGAVAVRIVGGGGGGGGR
jgi:hypothetical protein